MMAPMVRHPLRYRTLPCPATEHPQYASAESPSAKRVMGEVPVKAYPRPKATGYEENRRQQNSDPLNSNAFVNAVRRDKGRQAHGYYVLQPL